MKKCAAFIPTFVILSFMPSISVGDDDVCELLLMGDAGPAPATPVKSDPPNINDLVVQIYTTRDPEGLVDEAEDLDPESYRCALAKDLFEVGMMLEKAGFGGYSVGDENPIFSKARLKYISNSDEQEAIRDVVRNVLAPDGQADQPIATLKNNGELYHERKLNVYFVHFEPPANNEATNEVRGLHIRNEVGDSEKMIFYDEHATPTTLAHEFAHAFSAGHVNFWNAQGTEWCVKYLPDNMNERVPAADAHMLEKIDMKCEFSRENYMWAGSDLDRKELGDSQAERMRRNTHSVINDFSPPPNPFDCPDLRTFEGDQHFVSEDKDCPRLRE